MLFALLSDYGNSLTSIKRTQDLGCHFLPAPKPHLRLRERHSGGLRSRGCAGRCARSAGIGVHHVRTQQYAMPGYTAIPMKKMGPFTYACLLCGPRSLVSCPAPLVSAALHEGFPCWRTLLQASGPEGYLNCCVFSYCIIAGRQSRPGG